MYIKRAMEKRVEELANFFPVLMICGPRQVGKTTMLKELAKGWGKKVRYVTLDYPQLRSLAKEDPELFLQQYAPPIIIDEIQYAPELLPYIKVRVDESGEKGQYFLTGSQMFHMMKNVSESLAGRVGILTLYSLSQSELEGRENEAFLPSKIRAPKILLSVSEVFDRIYRGSMPAMEINNGMQVEDYYGSYMQTYLERDIRDLVKIKDESKFLKFISCVAARTGQEVVLADIARDTEIDGKTADNWLSILQSSGLVYLLQPYFNNTIKRVVKRPKLYFMDMGLACYLSLWNNPRALELSAMAGAMFENYVISEIIKSYANAGKDTRNRLCYYRDNNNKEIDLMILENGYAYPIEIKKSAEPGRRAIKHFGVIDDLGLNAGEGAVVCMTPMILPIDGKNMFVPVGCI
ncbi:MAG: ATP-binding protein [Hungatella sp.]